MSPAFWYWVSLAVFIVHNCEEYRTLDRSPLDHFRNMERPVFARALVVISLVALIFLLIGTLGDPSGTRRFIGLLLPASLVLNALFHLVATIRFRKYVPGAASAVVMLALSLVAVRSAVGAGWVDWARAGWALGLALVLQFPIIQLALFIGRVVVRVSDTQGR